MLLDGDSRYPSGTPFSLFSCLGLLSKAEQTLNPKPQTLNPKPTLIIKGLLGTLGFIPNSMSVSSPACGSAFVTAAPGLVCGFRT